LRVAGVAVFLVDDLEDITAFVIPWDVVNDATMERSLSEDEVGVAEVAVGAAKTLKG
jgi:hypothetical protein